MFNIQYCTLYLRKPGSFFLLEGGSDVEIVTKEHLADVALILSQPSQQYFLLVSNEDYTNDGKR